MKFIIKHEIRGRIRVRPVYGACPSRKRIPCSIIWIRRDCVISAKIQRNTLGIVMCYTGEREQVLALLRNFHYET